MLTFISPTVMDRVTSGAFVPDRKGSQDQPVKDRRNIISPLNVTRRCIRYDPSVFSHRRDVILRIADALNHPDRKILLIGGPQGIGKTSLIRGAIELMGSQREQLLWFDVTRHTDFEEIIQFLIQYITYIAQAYGTGAPQPYAEGRGILGGEPLRRLEALIQSVSDMPLLIVLDNVEYIVDQELRFNSYPFKEMLNFLLGFPNIKMILAGERLPFSELSPNQPGVENLKLVGLAGSDAISALIQRLKKDEPESSMDDSTMHALQGLAQKSHGHPWILKTMMYLYHQSPLDFEALNRMLEGEEQSKATMIAALIRYIYERLSDQQRRLFQILCLLRHPVDVKALVVLMSVCYPSLGVQPAEAEILENILEHSLIRPFLKISFPPQEVLAHMRHRAEHPESPQAESKFKPWYELYHQVKRTVHAGIPADEKERIHGLLQDFYLKEKLVELDRRVLRIKNKALLAEAKFHASASRMRKPVKSEAYTGPDTREEWLETKDIASRSYLTSTMTPLSPRGGGVAAPGPRYTLEDYRRIQLPEAEGDIFAEDDPDGPELDLSKPLELSEPKDDEWPALEEEKVTFQDYLAGIELTPEEERLLNDPGAVPLSRGHRPPDPILATPSVPAEPETRAELNQLTAGLVDDDADEAERHIHLKLAEAVEAHDKVNLAVQLLELAKYRAAMGKYDSANRVLEKAISLKPEHNKEILAEIYRVSGSVHKDTYHHNAALAALSKAAVYIKRLMYEDETVNAVWMGRLGQVYQNLGEIYAYRHAPKEAVDAFNQALRWFFSADDEMRQAEVYFQLAGVYEDTHDTTNAINYYNKALAKDEESGNSVSCAAALANLGNIYLELGQADEALTYMERSLVYDRQSLNSEGQLNTLDAMATIYLGLEQWEKAEAICQQGQALAIHEGVGVWKAAFYAKSGQIAEGRDDWQAALNNYQWAKSSGGGDLSQDSQAWIDERVIEVRKML